MCVGGAHYGVLRRGYAVERAECAGRVLARDLGVGVAHERVPNLNGAAALKDVDPHWASARAVTNTREIRVRG